MRPNIITAATVTDINAYTFKDMKLGESFRTRGMFAGVSDDPLIWRLTETNFSMTELTFEVSYCDLLLGGFRINPSQNNKVTAL